MSRIKNIFFSIKKNIVEMMKDKKFNLFEFIVLFLISVGILLLTIAWIMYLVDSSDTTTKNLSISSASLLLAGFSLFIIYMIIKLFKQMTDTPSAVIVREKKRVGSGKKDELVFKMDDDEEEKDM